MNLSSSPSHSRITRSILKSGIVKILEDLKRLGLHTIGNTAYKYYAHDIGNLETVLQGIEDGCFLEEKIDIYLFHIYQLLHFLLQFLQNGDYPSRNFSTLSIGDVFSALSNLENIPSKGMNIKFMNVTGYHSEKRIKINFSYLYRFIFSCIMNAKIHGRANNISIIYTVNDKYLTISIDDDGNGISESMLEECSEIGLQKMFLSGQSSHNSGIGLDGALHMQQQGISFHAYNRKSENPEKNGASIELTMPLFDDTELQIISKLRCATSLEVGELLES